MNLEEYGKVKGMSYGEYCKYLRGKYGCPKHAYTSKADARPSEGLFIHHIGENEVANLSKESVRKESDPKYQSPEMLCYCDWLEHLLLHIMIGEETAGTTNLGLEGCFTHLLPALRDFFEYGKKTCNYNAAYYDVVSGDKDVFDALLERYNQTVKGRAVVQEHNEVLYEQVEFNLEKNNKALVVLGTGLGKTLTAMNYLYKHTCRGLVICPNKLIEAGWERYGEFVDVTTYQSFALSYDKYDYSQYGLVVIDEAHHSGYDAESDKGAAVWSQGIDYVIAHGVKLLGLTATPIRSDGIDVGKTVFGGCVCEGKSVEDAIEEGIIHPFSYVTALYDTSEAVEQAKKYKNDLEGDGSNLCRKLIGQLDLAIQQAPKIGDILRKYMPSGKRKGIIFIQNIEDKGAVEAIFRGVYPDTEYRAIDSKMPEEEVAANRKWFEQADEGYLLAVNMISEGAHYKGVNTLIMFRTTASYLVYTQQLGRIITLAKNEDPHAIVFDLVNNVDNVNCDDGEFKKEKKERDSVQDIIRALKAVKSDQIIIADEARDIVECLKEIKQYDEYNAPWEAWEDNILKKYYASKGAKYCCDEINKEWHKKLGVDKAKERRSYNGISLRAGVLGIVYLHRWTAEEDEILNKYYLEEHIKGCQKRLPDKSASSIVQRAKKLGLCKHINWTDEEYVILKQYYPIGGASECFKRIKTRSKQSIAVMANKLGLKSNKHYWSETDTQKLKECYFKFGRNKCLSMFPDRPKSSVLSKIDDLGISLKKIRKFNEWEIDFIKENYQILGVKEIADRLNRSEQTVNNKVLQLGLREKTKRESLSEKEIQFIKDNYQNLTIEELSMRLNKSLAQVRGTISRLGLAKQQAGVRWSAEEIEILKSNYEKGCDELANLLPNRSKYAIINELHLLKLYVSNKRPWSNDDIETLRQHYPLEGKDSVAKRLGRTPMACAKKANILGIDNGSNK